MFNLTSTKIQAHAFEATECAGPLGRHFKSRQFDNEEHRKVSIFGWSTNIMHC